MAESEGMKKIFCANSNQRGGAAAILISAKIYLKSKMVTKDKEGNYIIIKGSIYQKDIAILKYMHQTIELQNMWWGGKPDRAKRRNSQF